MTCSALQRGPFVKRGGGLAIWLRGTLFGSTDVLRLVNSVGKVLPILRSQKPEVQRCTFPGSEGVRLGTFRDSHLPA